MDFALPYMNVALGVVSPDSRVIDSLDNWNADDQMIVISGTTAETYLTEHYPDIPLQKYDTYANAKNAIENGNGVAWANDNTEVIAFASQNPTSRGTSWVSRVRMVLSTSSSTLRKSSASRSRSISMREMRAK